MTIKVINEVITELEKLGINTKPNYQNDDIEDFKNVTNPNCRYIIFSNEDTEEKEKLRL